MLAKIIDLNLRDAIPTWSTRTFQTISHIFSILDFSAIVHSKTSISSFVPSTYNTDITPVLDVHQTPFFLQHYFDESPIPTSSDPPTRSLWFYNYGPPVHFHLIATGYHDQTTNNKNQFERFLSRNSTFVKFGAIEKQCLC